MSFEMNKAAGAVLLAMIIAMVSGIIAGKLISPQVKLKKNAYEIAGAAEEPKAGGQAAAPAAPQPIGPLLAAANADAGKAMVRRLPCRRPEP